MELYDLIQLCKKYSHMGWAVQQQLDNILDVGLAAAIEEGKVNPNALNLVKDFLGDVVGYSDAEGESLFMGAEWALEEIDNESGL